MVWLQVGAACERCCLRAPSVARPRSVSGNRVHRMPAARLQRASFMPRATPVIARRQVLRPGDTAVDATCGNGHDSLFMAQCIGPSGRLHAVDLQASGDMCVPVCVCVVMHGQGGMRVRRTCVPW
jgi:hypothetical protein